MPFYIQAANTNLWETIEIKFTASSDIGVKLVKFHDQFYVDIRKYTVPEKIPSTNGSCINVEIIEEVTRALALAASNKLTQKILFPGKLEMEKDKDKGFVIRKYKGETREKELNLKACQIAEIITLIRQVLKKLPVK